MNGSIKLVVALAAFAAAAAYDFQDSAFNEILADDLIDLYQNSEFLHVRNRRDEEAVNMEKCKGRRKRVCCMDKIMEELHDKDRELKRSCFREIVKEPREFDPFKCEKSDKHRQEMICVMQCVGQKKNLLDKEGNVNEEEFALFVKENFGKELWFEPLQEKVISGCLAEARKAGKEEGPESCNPAGAKLTHCLFREIQLNCPKDQIKDEKSCERLQERLKKSDDFPGQ